MDAVIDIGSNSVRLLLTGGEGPYVKESSTTTLAEGLAQTGRLSDEAMRRTKRAVMIFAAQARHKKVDSLYIFATEAVRAAENGNEFIRLAESEVKERITVLTGEEEARLGLLGAAEGNANAIRTVVDIGGASVELISGTAAAPAYIKSLPLGAVRVKEEAGDGRAAIEAYINARVKEYGEIECETLTAIGGTATSLAAMHLKLDVYDPVAVHKSVLTADDLSALIDDIFQTKNLPAKYKTLSEKRAAVIGQGAIILTSIMAHTGAEKTVVSEYDNMEGYLFSLEKR